MEIRNKIVCNLFALKGLKHYSEKGREEYIKQKQPAEQKNITTNKLPYIQWREKRTEPKFNTVLRKEPIYITGKK